MLIAEDLLLLEYDDEAGKRLGMISNFEYTLAGALLVELAILERISVTTDADEAKPGRIAILDSAPTGEIPLDDAVGSLSTMEGSKPKDVLGPLAKGGLADRLLDGLARRGILRRENGRVLGLFPTSRWPAEDSQHEDELRQRLRRVLVDGELPDERTAALIAMLANSSAVKNIVGRDGADLAKRRAKEIAEGNWASDALRRAVEEIVMVTVIVPVIVSSAGT